MWLVVYYSSIDLVFSSILTEYGFYTVNCIIIFKLQKTMLLSFWLPIKKQLNNDQQYLAVSVCRYKRSSLKCRKHVYWKVNEKKRQKTSNEVNNWQYIILRSTCFSGSKISTVSSHKINIG